ncbi:MAG TPA: hypothetical protein VHU18_13060 [Rhizomicrobium sp.]|jgi:hypothetical protein|nr:hypothetical protein [Rhizomicrobium sp.]
MPHVPDAPAAVVDAYPPLTTRGLKPTDINPDEMDDVIMRLFHELRRQLSMMENKKTDQLEPADRERHARILASLERTMERLVKIEAGRAAARKSKVTANDGVSGRKALEARIDRILAIEFENAAAERAER